MGTPTDPVLRIRDEHGHTIRIVTGSSTYLMEEARRLLRYYSDSHDATIRGTYWQEEVVATRDGVLGIVDDTEVAREMQAEETADRDRAGMSDAAFYASLQLPQALDDFERRYGGLTPAECDDDDDFGRRILGLPPEYCDDDECY